MEKDLTTQRPYISSGTWTLKPGETKVLNISGTFLLCADISGGTGLPIRVRLDDRPEFDFNMGLSVVFNKGEEFKRVTIRSQENDLTIDVTLYWGEAQVVDSRLNIVRGRANPITDASQLPMGKTITVPGGQTVVVDTIPFRDDLRHLCKYMKCAYITNIDPACEVDIVTCTNELSTTVFPKSVMRLETAFPFGIYNPNVQSVTVRVMQVWYAELTDPFSTNYLLLPKVSLKYIIFNSGTDYIDLVWDPITLINASMYLEIYHNNEKIYWTEYDASSGETTFQCGQVGWEVTLKLWFSWGLCNGPVIERTGVIGSGQIIT